MESLLLMEGFEVRSAVDGPQALRLIAEETPDLIVLDLMLPWMNGIEVLTTVRQQPHLLTVPVLVTTGTATTPFDLRSFNPVRVIESPWTSTPSCRRFADFWNAPNTEARVAAY